MMRRIAFGLVPIIFVVGLLFIVFLGSPGSASVAAAPPDCITLPDRVPTQARAGQKNPRKCTPTPTSTHTSTPTDTPTSTSTFTPTATNTLTPTPTLTATNTPTLTPSSTNTPTSTPDPVAIACPGSLAYYPIDEGSGTTIRDICNGFDGSWTQGVNWGTDAEGPHLQFTAGDGPRVIINQPILSQNTSITVEVRMMSGGGERVFSQMGAPNSGNLRFTLTRNGSRLDVWGASGDGRFSFCGSFPCLPAGQWVHVAFQINGTQVALYYDGVQVGGGTLPFPQTLRSTNAVTEIGTGEAISGFGGKIQYVRISSGIRNDFLLTRP